MKVLELSGCSHHKGEKAILQGIDLSVQAGEVLAILGPSGCGKSTLLRCINGLEPLSGGTLSFQGEQLTTQSDWTAIRQRIGMVFQHYQLFPHLTVGQNLLLSPLKVQRRQPAEAEAQARHWLAAVGLADKWQAKPAALSGGQQQRVAIARALMLQPQLMLFDEITASLDPEKVREVLLVLRELAQQGMTMLVVTHELAFARAVADRVIFMDQGRIVEQAPPAEFFRAPQTERAQHFLAQFAAIDQLE